MTDGDMTAVCPRCGSAAAVHSISELAEMARGRLGQAQPGPAGPQQGWAAQPQAGPVDPQQGWAAQPQAGPLPGSAGGPQPGWAGQPRAGRLPGSWRGGSGGNDISVGDALGDSIGDAVGGAVADIALGAASRFIGRAISRRVQQTMSERVMPTLAARQESVLQNQIAIAEKYPGLRACMTDKVIFLDGGSRTLPMTGQSLMLTVEQADALVAQLREG